MPLTLFERAQEARQALTRAGISPATAARDADLLARHALGWDLAAWLARRAEAVDDSFERAYAPLIARRITREPIAYIRGTQEFWGREFVVTADVLIPRPETELIVETAVELARERNRPVLADVGTGSGCIAVSLALECPDATIWATDISEAALRIASENAVRLGAADRVRFLLGPYLAPLPGPVDIVLSNPPYVAEADRGGLAPEVAEHEPAVALFGGTDGFRDVRALLREASAALAPGGRLIMEIGYGQSLSIEAEINAVDGLALDQMRNDLQGIPRVVVVSRT